MKSLRDLWIESGEKPFWARSKRTCYFHVVAVSETHAVGFDEDGEGFVELLSEPLWNLCDGPRKPKEPEKLVLWRCVHAYWIDREHPVLYGTLLLNKFDDATSAFGDYATNWQRVSLKDLGE